MIDTGFLVIRRRTLQDISALHQERCSRNNALRPIAGVIKDYAGFEGEFWPLDNPHVEPPLDELLLPISMLNEARRYFDASPNDGYSLLFVTSRTDDPLDVSKVWEGFKWMGYEYGYCDGTEGLYSCIMNEVICGQYAEMTAFNIRLNKRYLFDHPDDLRQLHVVRQQLLRKKADLEAGKMKPWRIWSYE